MARVAVRAERPGMAAWRCTGQLPADRIFPWRAGAGTAWIGAAEHRAFPLMDVDDTKVVDE
jgi:hypothetical protein